MLLFLTQWSWMRSSSLWSESWTAALVNHLWQSTVVAGIALLLTLALKKNQARVRYWVWMIASAKFLIPFSLLMDAGSWLRSLIAAPVTKPAVSTVIEQITAPLQSAQSVASASASARGEHLTWLPMFLLVAWICGVVLIAARWLRGWLRIRAALRESTPTEIVADVPVLATGSLLEPGVFGILRPVLLLPRGILDRLQPEQLRAIVVHEICHVRRRDNLTFAIHMICQALFWFHPLTWWIGGRLIEEREHACDEAVLESGGEAEVYAEGILNVCKFYVESPLACAAGVSGADLKNRIARIMTAQMRHRLNWSRKLLLGAAGFAAVLLPLMLGVVRTVLAEERAEDAAARLPKFEVASIKPHQTGQQMQIMMRMLPDGINISGLPMERLMQMSFGLPENRVLNAPGWVKSGQFDIEAKVDPADAQKLKGLSMDERWAMMVPVLQDRFGMKFHRETRDVEVYTLVVGKGGPKIKETEGAPEQKPPEPDAEGRMRTNGNRVMMRFSQNGMTLNAQGGTMENLTKLLSQQIGSTVLDKTGLAGKYDYTLEWMPERGPALPGGEAATENNAPPLFTAVQEQLGLKLVSQKEPVEVVVIDQIQQPTPN